MYVGRVHCMMQSPNRGLDDIFSFVSELARDLLGFADQGTTFLTAATVPKLGWFLVSVLRESTLPIQCAD